MKKFIIAVCIAILLGVAADTAYYRLGIHWENNSGTPATTFVRADESRLLMDTGAGYQPFVVRGVNMGSGVPGEWSTDFAISEETYLRWFEQMKEMGANTLRIYTIQNDTFYNAFYRYNRDNPDPLYLLHGVWVNDVVQNSHRDAYDPDFCDTFLQDCKTMVDVIHGQRKLTAGAVGSAGHGSYKKDISPWVLGYILGVEWEDVTVAYTDQKYADVEGMDSYTGRYLYTTAEATPFEAMLARVGDEVIAYESARYRQQRLLAFSNWPTTDPFHYPQELEEYLMKCAEVDVEHIQSTEEFLSGQFASYHVYPYYPDYLSYLPDLSAVGITDPNAKQNTYRAYLSLLVQHHRRPVVISEFGVSTGRGMAQVDQNTGRNQGNLSEQEQGQALVTCYQDIMAAGCSGGCVFSWQDEWFKRTWNTMHAVDLRRTPYWSDYQTNEQYFGLLSFDPGREQSICYVDGDCTEWSDGDIIYRKGESSISAKYDERFLYLRVHQKGLDIDRQPLYIPVDVTPKSGSNYCENYGLKFDRECDFIIVLNGKENSRVQVQERYEVLRANYAQDRYGYDTYAKENIPAKDSPRFVNIEMILRIADIMQISGMDATAETFETGRLTYGNANPASPDFSSLADFIISGDDVELKLPWQLLNFADPSKMQVHDDYYDGNYGIRYIGIDTLYLGLTTAGESERTVLAPLALSGWGNRVTSHERLKASYGILQHYWTNQDPLAG